MSNIIDGKNYSIEIQDEIKQMIKYEMIKPSVAVIQIGDNSASNTYIKNKQKACDNVGIFSGILNLKMGHQNLQSLIKLKN